MGNRSSTAHSSSTTTAHHQSSYNSNSSTTATTKEEPRQKEEPPAPSHQPAPLVVAEAPPAPTVVGLPEETSSHRNPTSLLLLTEPLVSHLAQAMPPPYRKVWKLLFSSQLHGHSFSRMTTNIEGKGPVLLVIKEEGKRGHYFGGFTEESWLSAETREEAAVSNSAARQRAQRTGCSSGTKDKPEGQAPNFFGSKECFVFTSGDLAAGRLDEDNFKVYPASTRSAANANYQYWFSSHPIADLNGLGMGSDKATGVGEFSWFVDRYLSQGRSSLKLCPTFNSLLLTEDDEFKIQAVEAYAVDPSFFLTDEGRLRDDDDYADEGARSDRYATDRMILELNGAKFYNPEREEC